MRPTWDQYFLDIAKVVSTRSEDPDIQHGAVIVNADNHIIGTGYNAAIKGVDLAQLPLFNRDEKRKWMIHAEENAILNCVPVYKNDLKIYITGEPCNNCLQRIINFGITEIIYADAIGSITENEETREMKRKIINLSGIKIKKV